MSPELWCAREDAAFDWREWDDEMVLFVHATGDTHALGPASSAVLATLLEHRGSLRTASAWYALMGGGERDQAGAVERSALADVLAFEQLLTGLEGIGVVRHETP